MQTRMGPQSDCPFRWGPLDHCLGCISYYSKPPCKFWCFLSCFEFGMKGKHCLMLALNLEPAEIIFQWGLQFLGLFACNSVQLTLKSGGEWKKIQNTNEVNWQHPAWTVLWAWDQVKEQKGPQKTPTQGVECRVISTEPAGFSLLCWSQSLPGR